MKVLKIIGGSAIVIMGAALVTMAFVPPAENVGTQLTTFLFWFVAGFAVREIFGASVPR